ncbi:MAG: hypothetical protein ACPLM9_00900 [Methanomassiliicoccales archaeon]
MRITDNEATPHTLDAVSVKLCLAEKATVKISIDHVASLDISLHVIAEVIEYRMIDPVCSDPVDLVLFTTNTP